MQSSQPAVFARSDTLLGVCEALGEDFGFNPLYLRVTLGVLMIWYPVAVLGAYAAAGAIVAFSRLLYPNRRPAGQGVAAGTQPAAGHAALKNDNEADADMAVAA
jgi:phage shock protein C